MLKGILVCPCGGTVEKLTETARDFAHQQGDDTTWHEYFSCKDCKSVYIRSASQDYYSNEITHGEYEKYGGKLTAEEITEKAPRCRGIMWS